jgi:hypothetical protein
MSKPNLNDMLGGANRDATITYLNDELLPMAVRHLNDVSVPLRMLVFDGDPLPSNQRNLTDVRTRVGNLLEWELGYSISNILRLDAHPEWRLVQVVANKFPDLEFRKTDGTRGIRLEVKAVDVAAEEKSANFDTLVKDIRAGYDYVVTLVWRWHRTAGNCYRHPYVEAVVAMDAEHLSKMRDTYWLSTPPESATIARQGFDLRFAVSCSGANFNQEEGNLGKLMRLFDSGYEAKLPDDVRLASTLNYYYTLKARIVVEGGLDVGRRFGAAWKGVEESRVIDGTRVTIVFCRRGCRFVVVSDSEKPRVATAVEIASSQAGCVGVVALNEKFNWTVYSSDGRRLATGKKPHEAEAYLELL